MCNYHQAQTVPLEEELRLIEGTMINKENSTGFRNCKDRLAIKGSCINADNVKLFIETRKLWGVSPHHTHCPVLYNQCCLPQ